MNGPGRPTKRTPEIEAAILRGVSVGASMERAARAAGIAEATLHRWCQDDPTFRERVHAARDQSVVEELAWHQHARQNGTDGEIRSSEWWLARMAEECRDPKQTAEVVATDTDALHAAIVGAAQKTLAARPEELAQLLAELSPEKLRSVAQSRGASINISIV